MADLSLNAGLDLLDKRTSIVRNVIYIYIVASVASTATVAGEVSGAINMQSGTDAMSMAASWINILYFLMVIASIVLISMWIYRAHANLRAADIGGWEFTPGWAVGYYFIPIANLFKPFQAMRELWNISHREEDRYIAAQHSWLNVWWGCWIVGNILSNISVRFQFPTDEGALATWMVLDAVSTLTLIVAAWFLLQIITAINAAQRSTIGLERTFA